MYRGGLKKCTPQKRDRTCAGIASASELIDSPEVLLAKMAFSPRCGATFSYRSFFQSMRSEIASMTTSHSLSRCMCWS